jgi:hypothetical protein
VCFDILSPPEEGKDWNVRGQDATKLMTNWDLIAVRLGVEFSIPIIENLARGLHMLFTWEYTTPEQITERDWLLASFKAAVDDFVYKVANGAEANYFHEFKHHTQPGLLKYSNDVQETVNCEIKTIFHRYTQRGGVNTVNTGH